MKTLFSLTGAFILSSLLLPAFTHAQTAPVPLIKSTGVQATVNDIQQTEKLIVKNQVEAQDAQNKLDTWVLVGNNRVSTKDIVDMDDEAIVEYKVELEADMADLMHHWNALTSSDKSVVNNEPAFLNEYGLQ